MYLIKVPYVLGGGKGPRIVIFVLRSLRTPPEQPAANLLQVLEQVRISEVAPERVILGPPPTRACKLRNTNIAYFSPFDATSIDIDQATYHAGPLATIYTPAGCLSVYKLIKP